MTDADDSEERQRLSDRRLGQIIVGVPAALILALLVHGLVSPSSGVVVEKTMTYQACRDRVSKYEPGMECFTQNCPRITYQSKSGRRKGTCLTKDRWDDVDVGDVYSERPFPLSLM